MTTNELLRCYVADRSEAAFAELVRQHIDLVYSAALRQVSGDAATAQDVTQAVFTELARRAPRLARHTALSGWLYTSARFLAAKARRAEHRRHAREQEAQMMNQLLQPADSDPAWQELRPLLDDVMHDLNAGDRQAVLLRYFERRPLAEIGARLGLSENTARMRVERALDKLRAALAKRGVTSTVSALAGALAERAVGAAPAELAGRVSQAACDAAAVGAATGAGVLEFLASTQAKLLAVAAAAAFLAGVLVLPRLNPAGPAANAGARTVKEPLTASVAAPGDALASAPETGASSPGWAATSNKLVLHIVAADVGRPVPSVTIDYTLLEATKRSQQQFQATRFGLCQVPVPRTTVTRLILRSQVEGFADTWLQWDLNRGDTIPAEYALRLARAVQIGGQVVDAAGQPVVGATVGFGTWSPEPDLSKACPETHVTSCISGAPTDSDGRWTLSRIAPEVFRLMEGRALHPEHLETRISLSGDAAVQGQLRADAYVFRLGRAIRVSGVILDANGQPVPEALLTQVPAGTGVFHVATFGGSYAIADAGSQLVPKARLHVKSQLWGPGPWDLGVWMPRATSQSDGTFVLTGCVPGDSEVEARAQGFVPTGVEVHSTTSPPPLRIVLRRGHVLRLRVVDSTGAPVPGAEIAPSGTQTTLLRADAEGRVQWAEAAAEEVTFQVRARGYTGAGNFTARADGQEYPITIPLSPALSLSGTVRDAVTGRAVPQFRIIRGFAKQDSVTHEITSILWPAIVREALWISAEGKFHQTVDQAAGGGITCTAFKFDAEGYAPFVTRVMRLDEGEVQLDVALRPAAPLAVTVLLPDGNVAVDTDVGLLSPATVEGERIRLRSGGLSRGYPAGPTGLATDEQGRFVLPPDDGVKGVVVANQKGYAEATREALAVEPSLRLEPWGRIEGTVLSGGRGVAGRLVQLGFEDISWVVLPDYPAVKTDDDGRFAFVQVPPGQAPCDTGDNSTRTLLAAALAGAANERGGRGAPGPNHDRYVGQFQLHREGTPALAGRSPA
jgi:RNA polymerase sigma factor (sigma-70 family)